MLYFNVSCYLNMNMWSKKRICWQSGYHTFVAFLLASQEYLTLSTQISLCCCLYSTRIFLFYGRKCPLWKKYLQPDWNSVTTPKGFSNKQTEEAARTVKMVPWALTPDIYANWVQLGGQGLCNSMAKSPAFEMKRLSSWLKHFCYCVNEFPNFVITSIMFFVQSRHSHSIYILWSSSVVQEHGSQMEARFSFYGNLGNVWQTSGSFAVISCYIVSNFCVWNEVCFWLSAWVLGGWSLCFIFDEDCVGSFHFDGKTSACRQSNAGIISGVLGAAGTHKLLSVWALYVLVLHVPEQWQLLVHHCKRYLLFPCTLY
jgi:hypothetical protein